MDTEPSASVRRTSETGLAQVMSVRPQARTVASALDAGRGVYTRTALGFAAVDQRTSLFQAGGGNLHILIGHQRRHDQRIQHRIAKRLPPGVGCRASQDATQADKLVFNERVHGVEHQSSNRSWPSRPDLSLGNELSTLPPWFVLATAGGRCGP